MHPSMRSAIQGSMPADDQGLGFFIERLAS
jgi:hypothetical protein